MVAMLVDFLAQEGVLFDLPNATGPMTSLMPQLATMRRAISVDLFQVVFGAGGVFVEDHFLGGPPPKP